MSRERLTTDRHADAGEPALPHGKGFAGIHFEEAHGPLFAHPVAAGDVGQGAIGDCYFLASVAAVAERRPDQIRSAMRDDGGGRYTVHFKELQKDGSVKDVPVTVDNRLPMKGTHPAFAQGREGTREGPEIRPEILEKAYAAYRGGYATLAEGGEPRPALESLTGAPCQHFDVHEIPEGELWQRLADATRAGKPMVSGTTTKKVLRRRTEEHDEGGIIPEHDYTLLGVEERDGKQLVKLRNPWASNSPHVPGVERQVHDDGVFEMPFALYRKTFSDVTVSAS